MDREKTEVVESKCLTVPLCPATITSRLIWDRIQVFELKGPRLTALSITWPWSLDLQLRLQTQIFICNVGSARDNKL